MSENSRKAASQSSHTLVAPHTRKVGEKLHLKCKSKAKPHRPIILLRRNSSGNITSHPSASKSLKTAKKHIPRLKSLSDIEMKSQHSVMHNSLNVKSESMVEFSGLEGIQTAGQMQFQDNLSEIKLEQVDHVTEQVQWQNSDCSISTQYGTFPPPCMPQQFSSSSVPFVVSDPENKENEPVFVKQEAHTFPNRSYCTYTKNAVLNLNENVYAAGVENYSLMDFREQVVIHPQSNQFAFAQQRLSCNPQQLAGHSFPSNIFQQPVSGSFPVAMNGEAPQQCFHPNSEMHMRYTMRQSYGDNPVDDSLTNITWLGKMGVNNFLPVPLERERKYNERDDKRGKPPYSYMALIQFAINSSATGRMTLRQIYQWIEEKFPYFKTAKPGWKNSIRHNLSLHDIFVREVAAGSKASYWTLRADLNMRPLTLDNMGGNAQHAFQDYGQPRPQSMWSLKTFSQGQKPILPRLPPSSRPYVLLPVPLLQSQVGDGHVTNIPRQVHSTPARNPEFDHGSTDLTATSPSMFRDSGICSDLSHSTPSTSAISPESGSAYSSKERSGVSLNGRSGKDISPMLSQVNVTGMKPGSQKKSRKEPLQPLNDSLNSSLQFIKESSESDSPSPSPRRRPLSPSGAQFLLCKKLHRQSTKAAHEHQSKNAVGFSDESFSEILNDLGSPFRGFVLHEPMTTPRGQIARKRRRSWGSPDSNYSEGTNLQRRLRVANETTPIAQQIRRVKSDAGDLAKNLETSKECVLPTSTPLSKEKWKKSLRYRSDDCCEISRRDNDEARTQLEAPTSWPSTVGEDRHVMRTPSPIPSSSKVDLDSDFLQDIMGTVFKTPDRPSASERHFDSLTPARVPFAELTTQQVNEFMVKPGKTSDPSEPGPSSSQLFDSTPVKLESLDNSFSKLLDLSGGSGSFSRFNTHFSDMADLNLSWSTLTQL